VNLLAHAALKGGSKNLLGWRPETRTVAEQKTPEIRFSMTRDFSFDIIRLREAISFGQRVDAFEVDCKKDGEWTTVAKATSIGNCRMIHLPEPVRTAEVRLRITEAAAAPVCRNLDSFSKTDMNRYLSFLSLIVWSPPRSCPRTGWIQIPAIEWFRLSREDGTQSLYFNQNAYTADGKRIIVTTAGGGISTITFGHARSDPLVQALSLSWWRDISPGMSTTEARSG